MRFPFVDVDAITVDDQGRVILSDHDLETLLAQHELISAGGSGDMNAACINFQNCGGSFNGRCRNTAGACDGATNANRCENPKPPDQD